MGGGEKVGKEKKRAVRVTIGLIYPHRAIMGPLWGKARISVSKVQHRS